MVGKIAQLIVLWESVTALPTADLSVIGFSTLLALLCLYIGFYFRHKISQKMFNNMTLVILLLLGINALFKAFTV